MARDGHKTFSRRERQIMDILYQRGRATGAEIHEALPDAPTYSAVRAKLRVLEEKGHVRHEEEALRYVYVPTVARDTARKSALRHMVSTFFGGSVEETVDATAVRFPEAAYDESIGSMAVARETVMIECGTIVSRNELE